MMAGPPKDLDALHQLVLARNARLEACVHDLQLRVARLEARTHDLEQKVAILTVENHRFSAVILRLTCQIEDVRCQTPTPRFSQRLVDPSD